MIPQVPDPLFGRAHCPFDRRPCPELQQVLQATGSLGVQLEVHLRTRQHRALELPGDCISATSLRHQCWTIAQMLTQHTVGGCNVQSGDLMGTGTISGPPPGEAGALVELSLGGTRAVPLPGTGEMRRFLEDDDCVVLRGLCEKPGSARVGFGECRGEVLPSIDLDADLNVGILRSD